MKISHLSLLGIVLSAGLFFGVSVVHAQNTHYSDYQYQLDQYRSNYAEYQVLLKDWQDHPTLNNEQKALISAKQTLTSRELAAANFDLYFIDQISAPQVDHPLIAKSVTELSDIAKYHFDQAQAVGKIATKADLLAFTQSYLTTVATHANALIRAQVSNKIAQLLKYQKDYSAALTNLQPRLAANQDDIRVKNGLSQISSYDQQVTSSIADLTQNALAVDLEASDAINFTNNSVDSLSQIRALEGRIINIIIDLDTNYASH